MKTMSNYVKIVLIVLLIKLMMIQSIPLNKDNDLENLKNCRALCEHCGCMGFYCGEECICECGSDNTEDIQCVSRMQSNCQKMNLPFEVLIQGPSGNRFVRSAFLLDQNKHKFKKDDLETRNKRSTVVIYKPRLALFTSTYADTEKLTEQETALIKREVSNMKSRREIIPSSHKLQHFAPYKNVHNFELPDRTDKKSVVQEETNIYIPKETKFLVKPYVVPKKTTKNQTNSSDGDEINLSEENWTLGPIGKRKKILENRNKAQFGLFRKELILPTVIPKIPALRTPPSLVESLAKKRGKPQNFKLQNGHKLGILGKKKEENIEITTEEPFET